MKPGGGEHSYCNVDPGALLLIQDGGYCKGGSSNNPFSKHLVLETEYFSILMYTTLCVYTM